MIFVGKTTDKGISSEAFELSNIDRATHVKVAESNLFIPITSNFVIENSRGEQISLEDMKVGEVYTYRANNAEYKIDGGLYSQMVFMSKQANGEGEYLRCDNGLHVRKTEIQPQAYESVNIPLDHMLTTTKHGKFYAYLETVKLPDDTIVKLPNDRVQKIGNKWYYNVENGARIEVEHNVREVEINKFLVGDKVYDANKLILRNGRYFISNDDGSADSEIGRVNINLQNSFVEGSSTVSTKQIVALPNNQLTQRKLVEADNERLVYTFLEQYPGPDGLMRIEINKARTIARFIYQDGHEDLYAKNNAEPRVKDGVETNVYVVRNFTIEDLGDQGIKFEVFENRNNIAENVKFKNEKLTSYNINGNKITDIVWDNDEIKSYKFNGVQLKDIEWKFGKIDKCVIMLEGEDGQVEHRIRNMNNSPYNIYAITCKVTESIKDVVWGSAGIVSFKMGDRKFTNITWNEDGTIKTCNIDGQFVDIENDPRFEQLKFKVETSLEEQNFKPLCYTKALIKENGTYKINAEYVQTSPNQNGVADVQEINNIKNYLNIAKDYSLNPWGTVYIDNNNKVHNITDVTSSYSESKDFEYEKPNNDVLNSILGKREIEYKKGKLSLSDTKVERFMGDRIFTAGASICYYSVIFIPIGLALMAVGGVSKGISGIVKSIRKTRLKHQDLQTVTDEMQENVKDKCEEDINELMQSYSSTLKKAQKQMSQTEYEHFASSMKDEFINKYLKIVGNLQLLDNGIVQCNFDMGSKKANITNKNYLAYLAGAKRQDELLNGLHDKPELEIQLNQLYKHKEYNDEEMLIKRVELLKKYGGKKSQELAYRLQKSNADVFIENLIDAEYKIKDQMSRDMIKQDYLTKIGEEFKKGKGVWGNIDDKIDYFTTTSKYIGETDSEKRKEMLKQERKRLEKEANSVKIKEVKFTPMYDKQGNNVADECIKDTMVNLQKVVPIMFNGNNNIQHFAFGLRDKMTKEELEQYEVGSFNSYFSKKEDNNFVETINEENQTVLAKINNLKLECNNISKVIDKMEESKNVVKLKNNYVKALEYNVKVQLKQKQLDDINKDINIKIDDSQYNSQTVHNELQEDSLNNLKLNLTKSMWKVSSIAREAQDIQNDLREEYESDVNKKAQDQFIQAHISEYNEYKANRKNLLKDASFDTQKQNLNEEALKQGFIQFATNSKDKAKINNHNELELLKVQNDENAKIEALALSEMNVEGIISYEQFINHQNTNRSEPLDINSEYAKLYYYTALKQSKLDDFKAITSSDEFHQEYLNSAQKYFDKAKQSKKVVETEKADEISA